MSQKKLKPVNNEAIKAIFVDGFGVGASETRDIIEICFLSIHEREVYLNSRFVLTKERVKKLVEMLEDVLKKIETEEKAAPEPSPS